jgi:anti-sigma-K factor RskA
LHVAARRRCAAAIIDHDPAARDVVEQIGRRLAEIDRVCREQLPRVKVGDSLTAINTQVLVVSITPKA